MRSTLACLSVAVLLTAVGGCNLFESMFNKKPKQQSEFPTEKPSPQELISYLNRNAAQIDSIQVQDLSLEIHRGLISPAINGRMVCQKSRNFRMEVTSPGSGSLEADVGSNDREFWFYVAR